MNTVCITHVIHVYRDRTKRARSNSFDPGKQRVVCTCDRRSCEHSSTCISKVFVAWAEADAYRIHMNDVMRKPVYGICEQQGADQPAQSDQHTCCSFPTYM